MRNWLVPLVAGLAAPTVLLWAWGMFVAAIWFPGVDGLLETHQVKAIRLWSFDGAWFFDAGVGVLFGIATSILIALAVRTNLLRACSVFLLGFAAAAAAPTVLGGDLDLLRFFLLQPLVLCFSIALVATFSLWARRQVKQNVS